MTKTTEQLVRIAAAGGGMIIDGKKTTDQLEKIAATASLSDAKIIIVNAESKTTDQLVRIATAGNGVVIFDLR